jgi:DNA-binding transcriptional MerR regulator
MLEEKLRSIGEVAKLCGVPVKTIRYYSDEGLLPPAEVTGSRCRLYGATEIWRLQLIRTLRGLGFGLGEVRRILSGELPAGRAISWQREAIAGRIRHLERLEAVLEKAESGAADPERSLDHLHAIGEALAVETEDRGRFLADKLLSAVMGEDAPEEDWRKEFIRSVSPKLPAEMSPEQEAAWVELVGLIGREDFVGETREQTEPLWGRCASEGSTLPGGTSVWRT